MSPSNGKDDGATIKGFYSELEMISKRGKGKTIEGAETYRDLATNISREELFKFTKELYSLSKRVIDHFKDKKQADLIDPNMTPEQLGQMIQDQLTDILPGMLQKALADHGPIVNHPAHSSAGSSTTAHVPITNHTLEIENKLDEPTEDGEDSVKITDKDWTTVVRNDVKGALKTVPVVRAGTSTNGTAKLHFQSKDDLDRAAKALEAKYKVTAKSEDKKMLDPKLTIAGIDPDIKDATMLLDEILNKNDFVNRMKMSGEEIKVVFFDKKDNFAVVQVSAPMREAIRKNSDRLCIGLEKYHVKDRYHVVQCFHCQEFGHMSKSPFCKKKDEDPVCFYCAGRHASKDCEAKKERKSEKVKCINCCHSKSRNERETCTTHKASDTLCPSYVREKERVMARTSCSHEAKNAYITRIRDTKRKLGRV